MVNIGILKSHKQAPLGVTPDSLKKWLPIKINFLIEKNAGIFAQFSDNEFLSEGAQVVSRIKVITQSNILVISDDLTDQDLALLHIDTLDINSKPKNTAMIKANKIVSWFIKISMIKFII